MEKILIIGTGGRVLGVTGYSAEGIESARKLTYEAISKINVPGGFHYREDIAKNVRELLEHPAFYAKLSEQGNRFVRENFSWEKYTDDVLKVFGEVMR